MLRDGSAVLEDFAGGVTAVNHPEGAGAFGTWYDATNDTFGSASASLLDGEAAMRIDDGGFTNGVYAIYPAAVPASGTFTLRAVLHVIEDEATGFDGIDAYQVGVATGGTAAHRAANPSDLPPVTVVGSYPGLTDGDDTGLGTQVVETAEFDAEAGDDVLVALGTDVESGDWDANSGFWNGGYVLVGSLELVPVEGEDPALVLDNDDGVPAYTEDGLWALSGGVGYAGGTYHYASTTTARTAIWEATPTSGFYEVQVTYRAGPNRAHAASYAVSVGDEEVMARSVDQRFLDMSWVNLGLVEVDGTQAVRVALDAEHSEPAGAVVIADAVRLLPSAGPPPVDPPELRLAAITVFDTIDDVGAIQATVNQLADLHYNAVAVHARYRGDATYFPNRFDDAYANAEPRSPQAGDVDVLEEFVVRGHDAGLQVLAYVNTHLVTDGADAVAPLDHVVNVFPEYRTWAYNGGVPAVQTTADDVEGLWLEPALPEVRDYITDIVGDIASNYAIDGVILDRIRYPQTTFTRTNADFGYHPDAVERFNDEYDKDGVPDPYDPDWIEFRQIAITETVQSIYARLGEIDSDLALLAYPIGRFGDAVDFNYQNWPEWLRGRHIDGVLPQIYTGDNVSFSTRMDEHASAYAGSRLLGVTTNAFSEGVDLAGQIQRVRDAGLHGTSPFRHGVMGPLGYLEDLEVAWDGVAEVPAMPWKGEAVARLSLQSVCSDDPSTQIRWRVRNPNDWSIEANYWKLGSTERGTYFAPTGDSFFVTEATAGFTIVVLSWEDHQGTLRRAARIAWGGAC